MGEVKQGNFGSHKPRSNSGTTAAAGHQHHPIDAPVLDIGAFRTRKAMSADRKSSVSETFSGMTSRSIPKAPTDPSSEMELAERIERIKGSIQRINQLMSELKGVSSSESQTKR
jgi:hypothetical protein